MTPGTDPRPPSPRLAAPGDQPTSTAAPTDDLTRRALDLLGAEVDRLHAQHEQLAAAVRARAADRAAQLQAAAERQQAAYAAEERAWGAWAAARDQLRHRPGDLTALAAADQAEAGYDTAREAAHAAHTAAATLARQLIGESEQDTRRLLELGRRARATQDGWLQATLAQPRPAGPAS